MKIYMISLKRDKERREQMQERFPRYYPKFHIIDAVDAKDESSAEIIQKYDKPCPHDKRRPLTKGEKCCAISHLLALESFLQSGDERCIIIEDDVIGSDDNFDEAIRIAANLNYDGLFVLGGQQGLKNSKYLSGKRLEKYNLYCIANISKLFLLRTCCYSVGRSAAIQILDSQKQFLRRADNWSAIMKTSSKIYYSNLLRHPTELFLSHLETERHTKSFLHKALKDGALNIAKRNLLKAIISIQLFTGTTFKLPV